MSWNWNTVKGKKPLVFILPALALAALLAWGYSLVCPRSEADVPRQVAAELPPGQVRLAPAALRQAGIEAATLSPGPFRERLLLTGELVLNEERMSRVSARTAGRVVKVAADYGAAVPRGGTLAVIDSVELGESQSAFLQAAADYGVALKTYQRAQNLVREKAISQAEFQEREGKFAAVRARMQFAENQLHLLGLNDADIKRLMSKADSSHASSYHADVNPTFALRSPLAGRVVDRKVTPGQMVAANEELFTVADTSTLWCFVQVFEKDLSRVRQGCPVAIQVSAYPGEEFNGTVDYVADTLDEQTRTARARVRVDNPRGLLKAGMFAAVEAYAGNREALAVPESAVVTSGPERYVFVEKAAGLYEKRPVSIGPKDGERVEVTSGLTAGERVVVRGGFTLKSELEKGSLEAE
jgi:cobalt-zinc-cadmium efflux system membrane fusion protein